MSISQCRNWPNRTGSDVEMFEILPRDWNLKPIFTQKWASVDMNWGRGFNPQPPDNSNPAISVHRVPRSLVYKNHVCVTGSQCSCSSASGTWSRAYSSRIKQCLEHVAVVQRLTTSDRSAARCRSLYVRVVMNETINCFNRSQLTWRFSWRRQRRPKMIKTDTSCNLKFPSGFSLSWI